LEHQQFILAAMKQHQCDGLEAMTINLDGPSREATGHGMTQALMFASYVEIERGN